jgi:hypothetical protein
MAAAHALASV